jgi:hypothetical protein
LNKQEYINEVTRINRRYENKYFPIIQREIQSQVDDVIKVVERSGVQAGMREANSIILSRVTKTVEALYLEVGLRFAKMQWSLFKEFQRNNKAMSFKGFGFNAEWVKRIKDHLHSFLINTVLLKVSEYTRDQINKVLADSIEKGLGIAETVKNLENLTVSKVQAARIARTEITRAANTGISVAGETFDFEQTKEWIAAHDKRTRGQDANDHASHIGLDGRIIEDWEHFTDPVNGDQLMYPGDPKASAASTINCRCVIALVPKLGSNGRLIPKK